MITINTNLSSLLAQRSLADSTSRLNLAIERMSTGYKINHAKDNAANFAISTNMTTQIGAYMVAEDNVAMGLDMLGVATSTLELIEDKFTRIRDLQIQTNNGTYGEQSRKAINSEINALIDEIHRLYNTAEYNGMRIFSAETAGAGATPTPTPTPPVGSPTGTVPAGETMIESTDGEGFINSITKRDTSGMTPLSDVNTSTTITSGSYSISTAAELAQLATMTNNNKIQGGEFVLADDIDLSGYSNWTPIGNNDGSLDPMTNTFHGTFDGNGHVVKNLKQNLSDKIGGLFGTICGATIKNLGIVGATVVNNTITSILAGVVTSNETDDGIANPSSIENCYTTGSITSSGDGTGGLIGFVAGTAVTVENSWSSADINSTGGNIGGLIGTSYYGTAGIYNSFYSGNVSGQTYVAGIIGYQNFFDDGSILGYNTKISNCVVTGTVSSSGGTASAIVNCDDVVNSTFVTGCSYNITDNPTINQATQNGGTVVTLGDASIKGVSKAEAEALLPKLYKYAASIGNTGGGGTTGGGATAGGGATPALPEVTFQVGIHNSESSKISINTEFSINGVDQLRSIGIAGDYISLIDGFLTKITNKQTHYGAASNRLESALDEIATQYENLVSSRSTLRDADIAEVSSEYIQQQILQQASSTLLSTANQSPSIALQLI